MRSQRGLDLRRELDHPVHVSDFIVVPGQDLHARAVDCQRALSSGEFHRPWTESNVSRCAAVSGAPDTSLMWTNSRSPVPAGTQRQASLAAQAVDPILVGIPSTAATTVSASPSRWTGMRM